MKSYSSQFRIVNQKLKYPISDIQNDLNNLKNLIEKEKYNKSHVQAGAWHALPLLIEHLKYIQASIERGSDPVFIEHRLNRFIQSWYWVRGVTRWW